MVSNAQVDAAAAHATSTNLGVAADSVAQADYDMASPAGFMEAPFLGSTVQQLVEEGHGLEAIVRGAVEEAEGTHQHVAAVAVVRYLSGAWCSLMVQRPDNVPAPLHWHDPGGKCEPGESPIQAAQREMEEEVGLSVDTPLHFEAAWPEPPGLPRVVQLFIAHADPSWEPEMREGQPAYEWVPLDERFFMRPQLPSVARATHHLVRWQRSQEAVAASVPMHATAIQHGPAANGAGPRTPFAEDSHGGAPSVTTTLAADVVDPPVRHGTAADGAGPGTPFAADAPGGPAPPHGDDAADRSAVMAAPAGSGAARDVRVGRSPLAPAPRPCTSRPGGWSHTRSQRDGEIRNASAATTTAGERRTRLGWTTGWTTGKQRKRLSWTA